MLTKNNARQRTNIDTCSIGHLSDLAVLSSISRFFACVILQGKLEVDFFSLVTFQVFKRPKV